MMKLSQSQNQIVKTSMFFSLFTGSSSIYSTSLQTQPSEVHTPSIAINLLDDSSHSTKPVNPKLEQIEQIIAAAITEIEQVEIKTDAKLKQVIAKFNPKLEQISATIKTELEQVKIKTKAKLKQVIARTTWELEEVSAIMKLDEKDKIAIFNAGYNQMIAIIKPETDVIKKAADEEKRAIIDSANEKKRAIIKKEAEQAETASEVEAKTEPKQVTTITEQAAQVAEATVELEAKQLQ